MKPYYQEITFKADKKHRDKYFSAASFAHPAKMMLPLQRWLIERYSKPGDVILDPMAGQGTLLIACTTGRHVIMVELESKFVQMQRDNWTKIQTLGPEMGYEMGTATILQGDARELEGLLVDKCIFSPPYALTVQKGHEGVQSWKVIEGLTNADNKTLREKSRKLAEEGGIVNQYGESKDNIGNLPYGEIDRIITSPPYADQLQRWGNSETETMKKKKGLHQENKEGIGALPYGSIDAVISSPPYEGSDVSQTHMTSDKRGDPNDPNYRPSWKRKLVEGYAETKRPYVDAVISSPPYEEGGGHGRGQRTDIVTEKAIYTKGAGMYSENKENIGEMRGDSYLSAMLLVYQNCLAVLKDGGLMILVTKNFIRNKQEVRLDMDTIKLCEQAGFGFVERHYRKLTSQSFWRTIYQQKYPDAPILDKEDILVFKRLWS